MAKVQIVAVRDFEGTGKESGRAYRMRNIKLVASDDSGLCEVGELSFFERKDEPLPVVTVGASYEPIFGFRAEKGKITAEIKGFKPFAKAA